MPGQKISELPFKSAILPDDLIVIVHQGETVHTTLRQLEVIFDIAPDPVIQQDVHVTESWESSSLGPANNGFSKKYIVTLNTSNKTMSFEALVIIDNNDPKYSFYGFVGSNIDADVGFVIADGELVAQVQNNNDEPVKVEIRPLT